MKGCCPIRSDTFDRSVSFTFYREWAEMAEAIEEDYGKEGTADYLKAIINYALYEEEPEMNVPIKYFWPQLKEKIDASQEHRAKGFGGENKELTEQILQYKQEHPEATQRDIANALKCSTGKVNKVLKEVPDTSTRTPTNTKTITPTLTTVNVNVNTDGDEEGREEEKDEEENGKKKTGKTLEDLTIDEIEAIKDELEFGTKYPDIINKYHLKYGFQFKHFTENCDARIRELNTQANQDYYEKLYVYWNCDEYTITGLFKHFPQYTPKQIVEFIDKNQEYTIDNYEIKYPTDKDKKGKRYPAFLNEGLDEWYKQEKEDVA